MVKVTRNMVTFKEYKTTYFNINEQHIPPGIVSQFIFL
jgi:hypothetical protein